MTDRRSAAPLVAGLALVLIGGVFLAANLFDFDFRFNWRWLEFLLPTALIAWGAVKLVRHFSWDPVRLSERPRRASLFSGLFWCGVGTVWLLDLLGVVRGLEFFGLYWPLLLVLFGLGKVVDYYRLSGQLQFRTGEVIGLLFLILVGISAKATADAHWPLLRIPVDWRDDGRSIRIGEYLGSKYSWTSSQIVSAEGLTRIEVVNLYGNVTAEPASGDSVEILLSKEVYESSENKARKIADRVAISADSQEGVLRVGTNRSELQPSKSRFNSHLTLKLPRDLPVSVVNEYGDVRLSNLSAPLEVENSYGAVVVEDVGADVKVKNKYRESRVRRVSGSVTVENQRGAVVVEEIGGNVQLTTERDLLSASDVQGDANIRNRFGKVVLSDVAGKVRVDGQGSAVNLSEIGGNAVVANSYKTLQASALRAGLQLETSNSRVELTRVSGPVEIRADQSQIQAEELEAGITVRARGTGVNLSEVEGGFDVATSLKDVTVEGFGGRGKVQNEYGDVRITVSGTVEGPLEVSNKYGGIMLSVPADAGFRLSAQSPGGNIVSDFNPQVEAAEAASTLESSIGAGGPLVRLQTTYADIRIRKR